MRFMRTWETTPFLTFLLWFTSILILVWIVISFSLFRNHASPFFVDSFSILSFSKAWNTTGIFSSKNPVFPVYPIQLVCVGSFRQWFLVLCLFRSANEFPGFTLPVYITDAPTFRTFPSDIFLLLILTEAQCTAVNMLLCFRSHWPHLLSFLVAFRLRQHFTLCRSS